MTKKAMELIGAMEEEAERAKHVIRWSSIIGSFQLGLCEIVFGRQLSLRDVFVLNVSRKNNRT